jgi:hypothetical protein
VNGNVKKAVKGAGGSTDSTIFKTVLSARNDSLVLSAAINAKPNFGDIRDEINDSLNPIRAKILADSIQAASVSAGKVNIADTSSMLSGYRDASILSSGTLLDARLSSNVNLLDAAQTITADKVSTGLTTARANGLGTSLNANKGLRLENLTATTSGTPLENSPSLYLRGNVWNTGGSSGGIQAGDNPIEWSMNTSGLSGNTVNNMDAYLDLNMRWGSNSPVRIARFTKAGLETNLFQNNLTLGQPGNSGVLTLNRSSGGASGQIIGDPAGIRITAAQIFLTTAGYIQLSSSVSFGSRFSMSTGLLIQPDANAAANSASRLSVIGNASIGANVAAPTNGLLVAGNTGLAGITSVTAKLHIAAGTTTASTGQIKLENGVNPTVAENGLINRVDDNVTFTAGGVVHTFAKTLTATATLDFPSTSANGINDLTITVTGAADGDVVMVGVPSGSATDGTYFGFVSATNTVTVRFHNSGGGSHDPASGTFRVSIIKY